MMKRTLSVALCALALVACGDDPVSYSAPVGINLKAKSSDTTNNTVTSIKAISTEAGNPYKVFVDSARERLEGRSPSRVELPSLTLLLGGQSVGAASLAEVFTGRVDVLLVMEESGNTYAAGHVDNPAGSGPVALVIDLDSTTFPAADYARLLEGKFNVVLRGSAAPGFTTKGADVTLQATFSFTAFE